MASPHFLLNQKDTLKLLKDTFSFTSQFSTLSPIHFSPKQEANGKVLFFLNTHKARKKNYIRSICSNFNQQMKVSQLFLNGPKSLIGVARIVRTLSWYKIPQERWRGQSYIAEDADILHYTDFVVFFKSLQHLTYTVLTPEAVIYLL